MICLVDRGIDLAQGPLQVRAFCTIALTPPSQIRHSHENIVTPGNNEKTRLILIFDARKHMHVFLLHVLRFATFTVTC